MKAAYHRDWEHRLWNQIAWVKCFIHISYSSSINTTFITRYLYITSHLILLVCLLNRNYPHLLILEETGLGGNRALFAQTHFVTVPVLASCQLESFQSCSLHLAGLKAIPPAEVLPPFPFARIPCPPWPIISILIIQINI